MKKRSAKAALELIEDGMIVGLGGGETIGYLVEYLSESHKDVKVVTPSFATEQACVKAGLDLLPLWSVDHVDLSFDGCDEVDQHMNALKSGGAIHTREKLIASMSDRYKFVAKNPHAYVWDESHISLDIYLEKNI